MATENYELPKKYLDMVGTKQKLGGGLFSYKKALPPQEYDVLNIRWGSATIINRKEFIEKGETSYEYPTCELLIKNSSMKKSMWTRGFAIKEIDLRAN
jgi:hypothetical protein